MCPRIPGRVRPEENKVRRGVLFHVGRADRQGQGHTVFVASLFFSTKAEGDGFPPPPKHCVPTYLPLSLQGCDRERVCPAAPAGFGDVPGVARASSGRDTLGVRGRYGDRGGGVESGRVFAARGSLSPPGFFIYFLAHRLVSSGEATSSRQGGEENFRAQWRHVVLFLTGACFVRTLVSLWQGAVRGPGGAQQQRMSSVLEVRCSTPPPQIPAFLVGASSNPVSPISAQKPYTSPHAPAPAPGPRPSPSRHTRPRMKRRAAHPPHAAQAAELRGSPAHQPRRPTGDLRRLLAGLVGRRVPPPPPPPPALGLTLRRRQLGGPGWRRG